MPLVWLPLVIVRISARPLGLWTLAHEYVPGVRLLRITVLQEDEDPTVPMTWNLSPSLACAIADGGPLFLTMNDEAGSFSRHSGELFGLRLLSSSLTLAQFRWFLLPTGP